MRRSRCQVTDNLALLVSPVSSSAARCSWDFDGWFCDDGMGVLGSWCGWQFCNVEQFLPDFGPRQRAILASPSFRVACFGWIGGAPFVSLRSSSNFESPLPNTSSRFGSVVEEHPPPFPRRRPPCDVSGLPTSGSARPRSVAASAALRKCSLSSVSTLFFFSNCSLASLSLPFLFLFCGEFEFSFWWCFFNGSDGSHHYRQFFLSFFRFSFLPYFFPSLFCRIQCHCATYAGAAKLCRTTS